MHNIKNERSRLDELAVGEAGRVEWEDSLETLSAWVPVTIHDEVKEMKLKTAIRTALQVGSAALCAPLAWSPQASAQDQTGALEEVIVTAQKREESLQDAPIAISALTTAQLETRGITGLSDLLGVAVPEVQLSPTPNNPATMTVTIRGIGATDIGQVTREPGVGIYLDGIYLGRANGLGTEIADLERIEVLRGPQGTLYGRNVVGGAVNLISRKPSGELGFRQSVSYGFEFDDLKAITHIDTPKVAGFSGRLSYIYSDHDGWTENLGSGSNFQDYSSYEKQGARVALNWTNDSNVSVDYAFDYSTSDVMMHYQQFGDTGGLRVLDADVTPPPDLTSPAGIGEYLSNVASGAYFAALVPFPNDEPSDEMVKRTRAALAVRPNEVDVSGHGLTVNWDINDDLTFRSLSSFRKLEEETHVNYGGVAGLGLATPAPFDYNEQEQWSQEFQIVGSRGDVEYLLGAYYFHEKVYEITAPFGTAMELAFIPMTTDPGQAFNPNLFAPFIVTRGGELQVLPQSRFLSPTATYPNRVVHAETDSSAVFGQARWQATDKVGLTVGLRYTKDEKEASRPQNNSQPSTAASDSSDSSTDPMVTVDYAWTDDVNSYLRYATGYKAGGVNLRSESFDQ